MPWKQVCVLCLALLLFVLTGCGQGAGATDPVSKVEGPSALAALGLPIDAPDGAEDVRYSTVSDTVAQVEFTFEGRGYCYRASRDDGDFSGVDEAFADEALRLNALYDGYEAEVLIRAPLSGGRLAEWAWEETRYSLYTADELDDDAITSVSLKLAEASHAAAQQQTV